jgi:hypothetical protein
VKLPQELKEDFAMLPMSAVQSSQNQLERSSLPTPFSREPRKYKYENVQL